MHEHTRIFGEYWRLLAVLKCGEVVRSRFTQWRAITGLKPVIYPGC